MIVQYLRYSKLTKKYCITSFTTTKAKESVLANVVWSLESCAFIRSSQVSKLTHIPFVQSLDLPCVVSLYDVQYWYPRGHWPSNIMTRKFRTSCCYSGERSVDSWRVWLSQPGGNQRELAREKNAKKQAAVKAKGAGDQSGSKGASLEQRKHR